MALPLVPAAGAVRIPARPLPDGRVSVGSFRYPSPMCGIGGILRIHAPGSEEAARLIAHLRAGPVEDAAAPMGYELFHQPFRDGRATGEPVDAGAHPYGAGASAGVWTIQESWLDILEDSVAHRGPDGRARFRDAAIREDGTVVEVALIHRRLSIIDHACGAQPMVGGRSVGRSALRADTNVQPPPNDGSESRPTHVAVVFNGCIYNHRELRKELEAKGHIFETDHSDTEVLIHGWREWGHGLWKRLDGMFSVLIWDAGSASLIEARDAFGEKPLYSVPSYLSRESRSSALSSSAAGLLRLGSVLPDQSATPFAVGGIGGWVRFGWDQVTPFENVDEVWTGHASRRPAERDDEVWWGWWADVLDLERHPLSVAEADGALRRAVQSRLEADVPLGCFLSGGIDSALVCRYASEVRRDITAFTVRMPHEDYDESAAATRTASETGINHKVLPCEADPAADLVSIVEQLGLPFGDSSLLPSLWVCRAARQHVKVALSGDGGDELFLGYDRYRAIPAICWLAQSPKQELRMLGRALPSGMGRRSPAALAWRVVNAAAYEGYKELVAIFPSPLHESFSWPRDLRNHHFGMTISAGDDVEWSFGMARRFDLMFYLPLDLQRKTDTASMRFGLEVRAPFLAKEVARLGIHASRESLMPRGQRKGLLRDVARKYFPPEIVDRPKMGFAIPIGEWFRSDHGAMRQLLYDHLESAEPWGPPSLGIEAMINMKFVRQMLREHDQAGEKSLWPWHGRDHSQRLYMLLVLSIWAKWLGRVQAGAGQLATATASP